MKRSSRQEAASRLDDNALQLGDGRYGMAVFGESVEQQRLSRGLAVRFADEWLLFGVYLVCHGGMLLFPNAYFWDDWIYYNVSPAFLQSNFRELGSPFNISGYLHTPMLLMGPWSYKLFTFVLFFASGLALNGILRRQPFLSRENRLLVVLLFLVLPFNSTRIVNMVFQYTVAHALFFLAWMLLGRRRIVPLLLFALSFNTNSLLVFYALPVAELFYRRGAFASVPAFGRVLLRHLDFIVLPFVFFAVDTVVFPPSGSYEGYNALKGFSPLLPTLKVTLWETARFLASEPLIWGLLLTPGVLFVLSRLGVRAVPETGGRRLLVLGVGALVLASFPYMVIGLPPHFWVWQSRHQLLLPLGAALVIVGLLNVRIPRSPGAAGRGVKLGFAALLVGVSIAHMVGFYASAALEHMKQKEVIRQLALHPKLKDDSLIVFDDRTVVPLNIEARLFPAYEWNGLLRAAFRDGAEHRLGIPLEQYPLYRAGKFDSELRLYRASKHVRDPALQPVVVVISRECDHSPPGCKAYDLLPRVRLEVQAAAPAPLPSPTTGWPTRTPGDIRN